MKKEFEVKEEMIDDDSKINIPNESDLTQCGKCLKLFNGNHVCKKEFRYCTICRVSLDSKFIKRKQFYTLKTKKYFKISNSIVCYQCACNIARELKIDNKI
ncbi:hypothetical protein SCCGRSA3_02037 [Marine Group I thaumarchaeote SCGC RSA3]|uniref:Uncharacterized protein n=2 Tax=Marine Group I TaxID=905826 RepID=A0A081RMX5_9ARCH|nr:hypothetical protein AAA799N04_01040 [Marine Group I thaumarchaeote SCGC AAA799-N04]KFM16834.1 hypothetical protein SCCGRSA3_02037 [Marine Group I thaumarchaeote SCGC RSA3]